MTLGEESTERNPLALSFPDSQESTAWRFEPPLAALVLPGAAPVEQLGPRPLTKSERWQRGSGCDVAEEQGVPWVQSRRTETLQGLGHDAGVFQADADAESNNKSPCRVDVSPLAKAFWTWYLQVKPCLQQKGAQQGSRVC